MRLTDVDMLNSFLIVKVKKRLIGLFENMFLSNTLKQFTNDILYSYLHPQGIFIVYSASFDDDA